MKLQLRLAALAVCFIFGFLPAAYAQPAPEQPVPQQPQQAVPLIEVRDLQELMKAKAHFYLLDVRTPDEFGKGHIEGAVLMPLDSLPGTYTQIPKDTMLVVYCRTGHRSGLAVTFLLQHGYDKAVSLKGGYTAWSAAQ